MRKILIGISSLIILLTSIDNPQTLISPKVGECTIGIFSGQATIDGRPIMWKNRDVTNAIQKFCYYSPIISGPDTSMGYIANCYSHDTTRVYMGINDAGFAVMNSNSYNLGDMMADGVDDGRIMREALATCRTISDFERILEATSVIGRQDCWNFGAIDAHGNGAIYEAANFRYTKYDVNDSLNEGDGTLIRATFSFSGDSGRDGFPRYRRATQLVREKLRTGLIDVEFVLQKLSRDLVNPIDDPYPLPYNGVQNGRPEGFILTRDVAINRTVSRSIMVVHGVTPGENPCLSTLWGTIGQPVLTVAYPMWVKSHNVPNVLNTGTEVPMFSRVSERMGRLYPLRGDGNYIDSRYLIGKDGIGLFTYTLPLESGIIDAVEDYLSYWRVSIPSTATLAEIQGELADSIYNSYIHIPSNFPTQIAEDQQQPAAMTCYPNPFNAEATISLSGFEGGDPINIGIFNTLGQLVRKIEVTASSPYARWDGRDDDGNSLASGVYLIRASSAQRSVTAKAIMMK